MDLGMFGLREAKRVRREDLDSASSVEDDDEHERDAHELKAAFEARMASLVSFEEAQPGTGKTVANTVAATTDEVAYSFRLFAGQTGASTQRIVLTPERDRLAGSGDGEEALRPVRRRPLSHYLKPEATSKQRENFIAATQTAEQIRALAQQRNWGLEVPWRVTRVVMSSKDMSQVLRVSRGGVEEVNSQPVRQVSSRKRRPGKKGRIRLRAKEKSRLADEKVKATKEEHLREKKQRLNRERKLKRRQKEREKKAMSANHDGKGGSGT